MKEWKVGDKFRITDFDKTHLTFVKTNPLFTRIQTILTIDDVKVMFNAVDAQTNFAYLDCIAPITKLDEVL